MGTIPGIQGNSTGTKHINKQIEADTAKLRFHPCPECRFRVICRDTGYECKLFTIYASTGRVRLNLPRMTEKFYVEYRDRDQAINSSM